MIRAGETGSGVEWKSNFKTQVASHAGSGFAAMVGRDAADRDFLDLSLT